MGESTLNCLFVGPAKLANPELKDGTCAAQGYTVATGETQTTKTPVGDIVITFYTQPSLESQGDCTVYSIGDGQCGESTLNCLYVGPAKLANPELKDGTCAAQGYTVATGKQRQRRPQLVTLLSRSTSRQQISKSRSNLIVFIKVVRPVQL